tara:strand:+ start:925 stop:1920 length:996 start_codon:yes stop_codon:yes gene_type:complete
MTVNSESFFRKISSKDKSLDEKERKIKLREDAIFNFQEELRNAQQINPEPFFQQGKQEGIQEGIQIGIQQAAESQPEQKNIFGFNEGGLVPNESGSFEFSIGRDEETGNIIKESFFGDTETIEETSDDGSFYSREETTVKGAGFITKFFERSSEDGLEEKQTLTERVLSIGVSDLIEHQDQLLGEIHKIDGFENVTIDDVLNGTTGLSKDQLFNILFNSDASMATGEKKDSNTDIGEELIMSSSSFTSQTQERYNSGNLVKADAEEAKSFNDLANSINQSVNTTRVKTVIQPINTITTKTVSNPVPTPVPVPATGVNVVTRDRKKSIAHKL